MNDIEERLRNPISTAELERRWSAVRAAMRDEGFDALVFQGKSDLVGGYYRWFTGQQCGNLYARSVIFPLEGWMVTVENGPLGAEAASDGRDPAQRGIGRKLFSNSCPAVQYTSGYDGELLGRELVKAGIRRVGLLGSGDMSHGFCSALKSAAKGVEFRGASERVDRLKAMKSAEEIGLIRAAAAMQDGIMARLRGFLRPGLGDHEITAHADYLGQQQGSEGGLFLGSSAPPGRAAMFRPRSQQGRVLQKGDVLTLLIENSGPGGYYAELSRTFVLGKPPAELADAHAAVLEAQRHTVKRLVPGASCADIFEAHNAFMRAKGLPEERRLYGHSQGCDIAERPLLRQDETLALTENMHMAVHPAIANARLFVTLTDNFLIGADGGVERLHGTPQEIIEVS
jgi:Xaa-Pro aminopeptidase